MIKDYAKFVYRIVIFLFTINLIMLFNNLFLHQWVFVGLFTISLTFLIYVVYIIKGGDKNDE